MSETPRPLSDTTVIELGHIVAGPFCALLLGDLGADVVKVEHPGGGDSLRGGSDTGKSSFNYYNRGKRSVTIDLKAEAGMAAFRDLVRDADVLVENYSPGTTDRLGVGYDDLREVNPGLVYCSIKGFNPGPYEGYPALDPVAEALAGLMSTTGYPDHPPARAGTSIADMTASFYGALSVVAALRGRDRTGEGRHITAPMFEGTVALMGKRLAYTQAYGVVPGPQGGGSPNWAPYDVYLTDDGEWVFVGPSSERHWRSLCDALDLDIAGDERFATLERRRENLDELDPILEARIAELSREEVLDRLQAHDVPVAPVNDTADVMEDEHLNATDAFVEIDAAEGRETTVRVPRYPARISGIDPPEGGDPPGLGEHTDEVLAELGYSAEEIERLREADAI